MTICIKSAQKLYNIWK